jgi:hypothetical protein
MPFRGEFCEIEQNWCDYKGFPCNSYTRGGPCTHINTHPGFACTCEPGKFVYSFY